MWTQGGGCSWEVVTWGGGHSVKQDIILNVRQLEFTSIPLKGWLIDPDVHGFLDSVGGVVCLLAHYGEIVCTDAMHGCISMVIYGGRGLEMLFQPFPKGPCRLPYKLLIAIHLVTLVLGRLPYFSEWYYPCTWEPQGRCFTGYEIEWETYVYKNEMILEFFKVCTCMYETFAFG